MMDFFFGMDLDILVLRWITFWLNAFVSLIVYFYSWIGIFFICIL